MKDRVLGLLRRFDGFQQGRSWLAVPVAVVRKFSEDEASNLAALISYYAFFSIFPLLMAGTTVLGFVLQGDVRLQHNIESSWLKGIPLIGNSLAGGKHLTGNVALLVLGLVLALWSGLAVARTAQTAFNSVYNVPKVDRPGFVPKTLRALELMFIVGVGLAVSTAASGLVTGSSHLLSGVHLGVAAKIGGALVAIAIDVGVFMLAFNRLTVRALRWRSVLPGATFAALAWFALQLAMTAIVTHKLHGAQSTYGDFATVIVLLSWFYLGAQVVLLAAEVNVVLDDGLWPRALIDKPQTPADERAFEAYAEEERYVDSEEIETRFHKR